MNLKICQIVLIGHHWRKLMFSIDKVICDKLIFITEKELLPGSKKASEVLDKLNSEYKVRGMEVENRKLNFHIPNKPIAELTHLIYQQKIQGYQEIILNISGGLRYMDIWMYVTACITESRLIHGDFIYEGEKEVGIHKNDELDTINMGSLTTKQMEFLELFFPNFKETYEFFNSELNYDENPLLNAPMWYDSIEDVKKSLIERRGEQLTRGSIHGFIEKLNRISALKFSQDIQNKKNVSISYIGIAFFLKEAFKKLSI